MGKFFNKNKDEFVYGGDEMETFDIPKEKGESFLARKKAEKEAFEAKHPKGTKFAKGFLGVAVGAGAGYGAATLINNRKAKKSEKEDDFAGLDFDEASTSRRR